MSIHPIVTDPDLINLGILAEQQERERAIENENKVSKQTHAKRSAEGLEPISKKL